MSKSLLVLAASLYQIETILAAKRLGYRVLTSDNTPGNPGHRLADKSFEVDTTDREGVLALARAERVDGIISPCTDVAVPTAAYVGEALGLPGPGLAAAEIACDKLAFRRLLQEQGFPSPRYCRTGWGGPGGAEPDTPRDPPTCNLQSAICNQGRLVLKPDRSSGSKGVFIVGTPEELAERLPQTLAFSPTGTALLEEFLEGHQGTCEGVLHEGRIALSCITDRQTVDPPYVATCGHRVPTRLAPALQERLLAMLETLWRRLGVTGGAFDCDFVATGAEIYLLEASPRMGGNSLARLLLKATGFDIVEYCVRHACGDALGLPARARIRPAAVVLLGVTRPGRLWYDEAEAGALAREAWVDTLSMDLPVGAPVLPFINGRCRVGEALISGEDRDDLDRKAAELRRRIRVRAE